MYSMFPGELNILDFTYELPQQRIAIYPLHERDQSKLLVYKNGNIQDQHFNQLDEFLPANSLVVFNNSKVVPARLFFQNQNGAHIEIFCMAPSHLTVSEALQRTEGVEWTCLVGNLKKWKQEELTLQNDALCLKATKREGPSGTVIVNFNWSPADKTFAEVLEWVGHMPLPPYIKREDNLDDQTRYQTVYAGPNGSVAAPTAGLHFTKALLQKMEEKGFEFSAVTLHVSAGTFLPVKAEKMADHPMHGEWMTVSLETIQKIQTASFVSCVGTTSLRTLESMYWLGVKLYLNPTLDKSELIVRQWDPYQLPAIDKDQALHALSNYLIQHQWLELTCLTNVLIAPPYKLKMVNALITNFHQPQSTLLLLVAAILDENWKRVYEHALAHDYRFLSYGDSSLIFA